MQNLRRTRRGTRSALETPVIHLFNVEDGRRATLVLTAHLGEVSYYQRLRRTIAEFEASVYFESVRSVDPSPAHWDEPYHRFLKSLREDIYAGIASLDIFAFQGDQLAPEPDWTNADVDCCALADALRDSQVPLLRYELAFAVLRRLIQRAEGGDEAARNILERALKWGLMAVSFIPVLSFVKLLPRTRAFYAVVNDWRSAEAVKIVDEAHRDFLLIYGAAHGETILQGLADRGFRETGRSWMTVFTT